MEAHIETIEAKAFRTFVRIYPLFRSEQLSRNIKLILHKVLIRSAMTYAWEFVAEAHLLKLQRLQNKILCTTGKFLMGASVCNMHMAFHNPYIHDYITKYADNRQKSFKIMIMKMFATFCKAKPDA
jgi:hypothetical protein